MDALNTVNTLLWYGAMNNEVYRLYLNQAKAKRDTLYQARVEKNVASGVVPLVEPTPDGAVKPSEGLASVDAKNIGDLSRRIGREFDSSA